MIPYTDFRRLLTDTTEFATLEAYIAECGGSVPLDDAQAVCKLLEQIWVMGHNGLTVKSIMEATGFTMRYISEVCGMHYNTIQQWHAGLRAPAPWALPLIAYAMIGQKNNLFFIKALTNTLNECII